jgi:hypothetical protein
MSPPADDEDGPGSRMAGIEELDYRELLSPSSPPSEDTIDRDRHVRVLKGFGFRFQAS